MEQDKVRENHRSSDQLQQNLPHSSDSIPATPAKPRFDPVRAKPQLGLGFAWVCWFRCFSLVVVFDCWGRRVFGNGLLCLIVWEEDFLEMGLCFCFFNVFHCFCFCWVSTEIEFVNLDFNLTENEFDGLEFSIPKLSLLHSRC